MDPYPEHEKLKKVSDKSQAIGEFLDTFLPQQGIVLMEHTEYGDYVPTHRSIQSLLAEFFGIDQKRIDAEKDAMLDAIRAANP
jgi:hypothetical protein